MLVIGLTGSIAMGKSEAASYLATLGLPVFDSDAEVHKVYNSEAGATLLSPLVPEATKAGKVDREILTALIMKDSSLLSKLERLVHAEIRSRREAFLTQAKNSGAKAAILDIPLLYETGSETQVDKVIVISSSAEMQRQRALARPGMNEDRLAMVLARQLPDAEKQARADAVIRNNSTIQELQNQLHALCGQWGLINNA